MTLPSDLPVSPVLAGQSSRRVCDQGQARYHPGKLLQSIFPSLGGKLYQCLDWPTLRCQSQFTHVGRGTISVVLRGRDKAARAVALTSDHL